jgi:hypothetical protein
VFSFTHMTVLATGRSQRVWEQPYQSFDIGVQGSVVLELQQSWQQLISAIHDRR